MGSPRDDALAIWRAGVEAVDSERLVKQVVHIDQGHLVIGKHRWRLDQIRHIEVVGAGKAGAGMAAGLEAALGPETMATKQVDGWINVPADCVRPLAHIHLHPARPPGLNEPTPEGVVGAEEILRRVQSLQPHDLCICLISGGGSALLPAPRAGVRLADLLQITRELSGAGATIQQLNAVRKQLSRIQGGRLALACGAGQLVTLVISDVMGDPLDMIASGPTVIDAQPQVASQRAIDVLTRFSDATGTVPATIDQLLRDDLHHVQPSSPNCQVFNLVIGNNATAAAAARDAAQRRGYRTDLAPAQPAEMTAEEVGRGLAERLLHWGHEVREQGSWCLISGGEPVVQLVPPERRGQGGRNQQLVLAALCHLLTRSVKDRSALPGRAILSGGTDGEDGPTDAAGAVIDEHVVQRMRELGLDATEFLHRNDAYPFFAATDGLIRTGPTHTNVCDIRVVLAR